MNQDSQRSLAEAAGLFDVLIHLHVLHAASKSPVSAAQLVELLTQRGYKVSNQEISALLRRFERRGWLRAHKARKGTARLFQATREGKTALQKTRPLVSALFMESSSEPAPQ
jgi:DNA-binding PadR family transcriptional regulator